ncbi:transporter substrate-binding domain-containing protein [Streptomyces sp. MMS21 TC-5]|uniref:transporter substrate-binding domain-containing protein n=1 Tax=Streptomyces sp. MMS21 TC-5 TaxID=2925833 RepID=UPI001F616D69|nr:transporter substrate-binding domain-containing protein [Streptomyces sp. MMS21 TC-5]MCI4079030.1 transporter substrate-binding domain-containing protein [Streptomyces sp. MMS21 TC-5]
MPRQRRFVGRPHANALAVFIVRITDPRSTQEVSDLMGTPSRATWAKYMNGSAVIPRRTLGALVRAVCGTDERRRAAYTQQANRLWRAADDESRRPEDDGGESALVRLHERLAEAVEARHRAELVAAKANAAVGVLRDMRALMESVIDSTRAQLRSAADRERSGLRQLLVDAERRAARIEDELGKAQGRRYTAEQAQQALAREVFEAREEIARLRHSINRMPVDDLPAAPSPALPPTPEIVMDALDDQLATIVGEGAAADEELAGLLEQADLQPDSSVTSPPTIPGVVIDRPGPDRGHRLEDTAVPAAGADGAPRSRRAAAARHAVARRRTRTTVGVCLALLASLGVSLVWDPPPAGRSGEVRDVLDGDRLTIGVSLDSPGLGEADGITTLRGFESAMAPWLARRLGFADGAILRTGLPGEERGPRLRSGQVDMVIARMEITAARKSEFVFVGPYLKSHHGILVMKTDKDVSSFKDLAGRRVCTRVSSPAEQSLVRDNQAVAVNRNRLGECVAALRTGSVDAVVGSQVELFGYTQKYDDLAVPPAATDGQEAGLYAVALPAGTPDASCRRVLQALREYVRGQWKGDFGSQLGSVVQAFPTTWTAFAPTEGDLDENSSCASA